MCIINVVATFEEASLLQRRHPCQPGQTSPTFSWNGPCKQFLKSFMQSLFSIHKLHLMTEKALVSQWGCMISSLASLRHSRMDCGPCPERLSWALHLTAAGQKRHSWEKTYLGWKRASSSWLTKLNPFQMSGWNAARLPCPTSSILGKTGPSGARSA